MHSFKTTKGTELPIRDLKGKAYLDVKYRILWVKEEHPDWGIETDVLAASPTEAMVKATIKDANGRILATGHKTESKADFPAGFIEKAETGAIGRALALCGYGTQFTADLDEGERIVDSPVEKVRPIPTPHAKAAAVIAPKQGAPTPIPRPGLFVPESGKYTGKALNTIPVHELEGYLGWIQGLANANPKTAEIGRAISLYLDTLEPANPTMIPTVELPPMPSGPTYPVGEDLSDVPF